MEKYLLSLTLFVAAIPQAQAAQGDAQEVFVCVDDKGHREYKNTGTVKGCKKVELPGITTIPAPPKHVAGSPASSVAKAAGSGPAEFPKVDSATQKARDNDRKQILQDELKSAEQKLANLRAEYHGGEPERIGGESNFAKYQERVAQMKADIDRTEKDVDAIKREIANAK